MGCGVDIHSDSRDDQWGLEIHHTGVHSDTSYCDNHFHEILSGKSTVSRYEKAVCRSEKSDSLNILCEQSTVAERFFFRRRERVEIVEREFR